MPRGKAVYVEKQDKPLLTSLYSANFAFIPAEAIKKVPLDPYTPNLFSGEEFYVAARFWTNGYDFYTPQEDILYHFYTRKLKIKKYKIASNRRTNYSIILYV